MLTITVEHADEVVADLSGYSGKVTRGAVRALNRAIASGRTAMVKEIARDTGLKSGDVRDAIPLREASPSHLEATFAANLKRIPLLHFKARQTKHGVSYNLGKGLSRRPHAFIATMQSGHQGVFQRASRKRLGIAELYGPSLGHVFAKHRPLGLARTKEAFDTAFAHELSRLTEKQGGG